MQEQVNVERTRARHLLHISQEIIKLKLRLDEELSYMNTSFTHSWSDKIPLDELKQRISQEIDIEKENRQKLDSFYTDIHLAEKHLKEYRMTYPDGPSSFNINEHLYTNRLTLEQFTTKLDSYEDQLYTFLTMIEKILPMENHIEQKLTSNDYPIDFQEIQTLIDNYERMIPMNKIYLIIKNHCEYKLDLYKKLFHDLIHKQEKHVSFDGSINFNNNNSTIINSSTSSSNSSTPQQHYSNEIYRNKKNVFNKSRQTEIQDVKHTATTDTATKQSTTSSYISDDCKVLYIETVIEVNKPVFYERTTDTSSTTKTESHHHHHHIPQDYQILTKTRNKYLMDDTNHNHHDNTGTEDELPEQGPNPVNGLSRKTRRRLRQQHDSGLGSAETSSSSTLNNPRTSKDQLLFPPPDRTIPRTYNSQLFRRIQNQEPSENDEQFSIIYTPINRLDSRWERFKRQWFRSLLLGLLLLSILFIIYLSLLDNCSRAALIHTACRKLISIESEGLPTI